MFSDLLPALQDGEIRNMRVPRIADTIYGPNAVPNAAEDFALGMASINGAAFRALAAGFAPLRTARTHVDIGGSVAALSCELAKSYPRLHSTSCDLPHMAPLARRYIERAGLGNRVTTMDLDFILDSFQPADVITMSMVRCLPNRAGRPAIS